MIELEFLGKSGDTHSLVFTDAQGERYNVAISDELRAALRRDPTVTEGKLSTQATDSSLRPAQIQAMLREGRSAEEIASQHGVPLASITRWESPVQAEKDRAVALAKAAHVGTNPEAPQLEDLAINRLAARGVDHNSFGWTASRHSGEPWEVTLTFVQGAAEKTASWSLSSDGTRVNAIDEEANWITETASPLAPVTAFFPPGPHSDAGEETDQLAEIESLLDRANAQRGRRQPLLEDFDGSEEDEILTSPVAPFFSSRVHGAVDAEAAPDASGVGAQNAEPGTDTETAKSNAPSQGLFDVESADPEPQKKRGRRRSVPSWDEIVFGTRSE